MATATDSTPAPINRLTLLRGGRSSCRVLTDAETIAAIEADNGSANRCSMPTVGSFGLLKSEDPDEVGLVAARALHSRRALAQALDYGFALLDALDLPPLALDVIDDAIAYMDAWDAPGEDLEPYLAGPYNGMVDPGGEREDEPEHDEDCDPAEAEPDKEPSLGWLNDYTAAIDHQFEATDTDVEAVNEDGDDCGEAHAPWWNRIDYTIGEGVHG